MKTIKFITLLAFIHITLGSQAQDKIYYIDGASTTVNIIEVNDDFVIYKMTGTDYEGKIKIKDVHKIEFQDGTTSYFNEISSLATPHQVRSQYTSSLMTERNPGKAFIMSFFVPGSGQMYNHQIGKGLAIFWIEMITLTGSYVLYSQYDKKGKDGLLIGGIALSAIYFGVFVYNVCDAPITANKINNEKGLVNMLFKHDLHMHMGDNGLGLALSF